MRLNADIIYQNLKKNLDVTFSGDNIRDLVLFRPQFYLENQLEFESDHVYVCSADHLPENPSVGENVLLVCLGSKTPPAYFFRSCSIITVSENEDIFRVFNLVQDVFNRYESWEGRLNEVLRGNASVQQMLDISKDIFENPLLLIGSDFNYLAYTDEDYLKKHMGINFDSASFDPDLMATFLSMHEIATNIREPLLLTLLGNTTLSVNIFNGDEYLGCITIFGQYRQIRPSDTELCVYFSQMLRQAFLRSPHLAGVHSALRQAIHDIVNGLPVTEEQRSLISRENYRKSLFFICFSPEDSANMLPRGYISSLTEQQFPGSVAFEHGENINAVIATDHAEGTDYRPALLSGLEPFLEKIRMNCGISRNYSDIYLSSYACFQAQSALKEGLAESHEASIFFYEDIIPRLLLRRAFGDIPPRFFQTDGLARLYRHDASSPVSYAETLKVYLDCNMSVSETARKLALHRSSLIDRLGRITQMLGADLDEPSIRLALMIVLHADDVK